MLKRRVNFFIAFVFLIHSIFTLCAFAADPYPSHPIKLIVPNPPGGSSDANARILSESLSTILKQPVVVEFKPGVGGGIGNSFVAKSKPDGYTLLMGLSSLMVSPEAEKVQGKTALYSVDELEPVAMISNDPLVMLVRTDAPWKTLGDLVKAAKEKPNEITYSSSGNFGPIHLSVEMLAYAANVKFMQIPFGGGGPSMMALLGSTVDMTTVIPSVAIAQMASGKVRPIAVSSPKRIKLLPDVPSYREAGFDAEFNIWNGLFVPKGTPKDIIEVLRKAVKQAVDSGEMQAAMEKRKMIFDYRDANEFKQFAKEDGDRMVKVVREIGKLQ
jgi:tripartite-type tricarboxylate transporter receptor subunit TctC